jgi:tRNA 2-thiouridine synthesizing protein A
MLDARGEKCPLPVLKTEKALSRSRPGQLLVVLASDPVARIDIALYCRQNGHGLVLSEAGGVLRFEITCGGAG